MYGRMHRGLLHPPIFAYHVVLWLSFEACVFCLGLTACRLLLPSIFENIWFSCCSSTSWVGLLAAPWWDSLLWEWVHLRAARLGDMCFALDCCYTFDPHLVLVATLLLFTLLVRQFLAGRVAHGFRVNGAFRPSSLWAGRRWASSVL